MDTSATVAGWLSFAVTAIGLGGLISQASAIRERLDPFHTSRTVEHLGAWVKRQPKKGTLSVSQPNPVGPVMHGKLTEGFCGINAIGVSRLPREKPGKATWTAILGIFHPRPPVIDYTRDERNVTEEPVTAIKAKNRTATALGIFAKNEAKPTAYVTDVEVAAEEDEKTQRNREVFGQVPWEFLLTQPLVRVNSVTCVPISRTTFMTILSICNARTMFRYSDASGHRASYVSYCGHFYIEWPLGGPAIVYFYPHDSHSTATDVYPPMFRVRVDKCIRMMAGVVTSKDGRSFQCAFPGRRVPGRWRLEFQRKGFAGAHGGRHLYNLMGGKVYEVDYLHSRLASDIEEDDDAPQLSADPLELSLPSKDSNDRLVLLVHDREIQVLEQALDCLPWSSLSWSIHRGLKDILIGFGKRTMDRHRHALASTLRSFVLEHPWLFEANGWSAEFVRGSMADVAANSVLAGRGNSGDSVRVVTDVAAAIWFHSSSRSSTTGEKARLSHKESQGDELDETTFWQNERHRLTSVSSSTGDRSGGGGDQSQEPRESREPREPREPLSIDGVIALTKVFVLEWSNEFDYQMYHDLPPELLFR